MNINISKRILIFFVVILFEGCASNDHMNYKFIRGVQQPSPLNDFTGGIYIEPFSMDHIEKMSARCAAYGGLDYSSQSIIDTTFIGEKVIKYKCNNANLKLPIIDKQAQITVESQIKIEIPDSKIVLTFDEAKQKCTGIGFIVETEGFGKCVLQLTK